jgi:hypothetical protein
MAVLEELLYQQLTGDATMTELLATWSSKPAVFEYRAPDDKDKGWGSAQYPRIDYIVQRREDPERRVQGTVLINVWDTTEGSVAIESVSTQVLALLDGSMYHPDDEPVEGLRWSRSELFSVGREQSDVSMGEMPSSDLIYGMYLEFNLLAFPLQTTFEPDPITALTNWAASITGIQSDPMAWTPTSGEPALYWRFESQQVAELDQAVTWFNAIIYGHILGPQPQDRLKWTRQVTEKLATDRCIVLSDGSPMFVQKLSADTRQDPLKIGQIKLTARYGVLQPVSTGPQLNNAYLNGEKV